MATLLTKIFILFAALFGAEELNAQSARTLVASSAIEQDTQGTNIMWCDVLHSNTIRVTKLDSFKISPVQLRWLKDTLDNRISVVGANLSVVKAGNIYTVSNTGGTGFSFNVCDPDSSATNELQDLSLSATKDTLSITGGDTVFLRRQEVYSGTTNASGLVTFNFNRAYGVSPNVQPVISPQPNTNQGVRISAISPTAVTIHVFQRNSVNLLGIDVLLSNTVNVNNAAVEILVTEK